MAIQIASSSMFGLALQTGLGVPKTNSDNADFRYFQFTGMPYGLTQPVAGLPQEAGSTITPRGSYKSGIWGAGQVSLIPRLVDDFGVMLRAALGRDRYTPTASALIPTISLAVDPIFTTTAHGHSIGDIVTIAGITGDMAALNGTWVVKTVPTTLTFTLVGAPDTTLLTLAGSPLVCRIGAGMSIGGKSGTLTAHTAGVGGTLTGTHALAANDVVVIRGGADASGINGIWVVASVATTVSFTCKGMTVVGTIGTTVPTYTQIFTPVTGVQVHTLVFNESESDIPYFTVRRVLEGTAKLGEVIPDNRVQSLDFNIPAVGPLTAALTAMGRVPDDAVMFVDSPDTAWVLPTITYDNEAAFALSVDPNSSVKLNGLEIQCTGLSITQNNNLLPPDQSRVIGSQTPLDFPVLSRAMTIQATCFVENWDLYRELYTDSKTGTTWSTRVKTGDIDFRAYSPVVIIGSVATQMALQIMTCDNNIEWALSAPLAQNPGQPLIFTLTGTVRNPSTPGIEYVYARLQNAVVVTY